MIVLALDPGTTQTAWVYYDTKTAEIYSHGLQPNAEVAEILRTARATQSCEQLACEMVGCYGQVAGKSLFDTCVWIGRFLEAWSGPFNLILRRGRWGPDAFTTGAEGVYDGVTMCLCGSTRAKDPNVRQAILDRYQPTGGGKVPQIGTKSQPGPLYGFAGDEWAALAVAITYAEATRKILP